MKDSNATLLLGTEPIGKLLLRYSLPAIAAMVVFSLYNVIDSIFIGHGVGPLAISGLAITFPVMNLTFALVMLVGIGGASISSIRLGQQDMEGASRVLGNVLLLGLINGVGFGLGAQLVLDPVLRAFGASPETLPYARDFMQIILLGFPSPAPWFGLNHMMRATGYPHKAMLSAVVTVGVNIILARCSFLAALGHPRGGYRYGALAVHGHVVGAAPFPEPAQQRPFPAGHLPLALEDRTQHLFHRHGPLLLNVCACFVVVLVNTGLKEHGGDLAIGAFGIINRVIIVFVMIVMGLTQGMQPIVGYNYGAQRIGRVRQTLRYGIIGGGLITTAGFLSGQFAPAFVSRLFTTDEALIALSVEGMRLVTLVFPLVGIQIVIGNFFQSIGKAKLSIFLSLTRQLLFLVPCLILLPRAFGLDGIWLSLPLSDVLSFVTTMAVLFVFSREMRRMHAAQEQ